MRGFVGWGVAAAALSLGLISINGRSTPAQAADMPVKAPPAAIVQQTGNIYIWVDGSYQSVRLPTYDLGYKVAVPVAFNFVGNAETHRPRLSGYGISAAVGFLLPPGMVPGSNARIEIGSSYVDADASSYAIGPAVTNLALPSLSSPPNFHTLALCTPTCQTASTLNSDYAAWQVWGKAATDLRSGNVTLTPSVTLFGGHARNNQDFLQQLLFPTVSPGALVNSTYTVNSALGWTDVGAKVGLDAKINLMPSVALGFGGTVGAASRHASLTANDRFVNFASDTSSAIDTNASTIPFLASAEASITVRPLPAVVLRGFVGLNYDSRVPGISAPTWTGPAIGTTLTPAGIKFASETSWYAGGGAVIKFGP